MDVDDERRQELAEFLSSRRRSISPSMVGLPVGGKRRTAGLRREEVAILAGVSPTWYTYLEQGRKIRPSIEVLDSLARVLQLSVDEYQYLHMLALGHPPPRDTSVAPAAVPATDELQDVIRAIGSRSQPVYATDWLCDILAWNQAAAEWYTDWAALPSERRNMLWWLLNDPEARDRLVDWEAETRDVIGRFRALAASRRDRDRSLQIMTELRRSPEFVKWWDDHTVTGQRPRERELVHPTLGQRRFTLCVLYPSGQDERMVVLHPPIGDSWPEI